MTPISQRDPRWASLKLGTSSTDTIGNYGCLITCFAMYVGKTPIEINDLLKANGGYQDNDLFIWSKCTLLGLNETYVSPRYASTPVTSTILNKLKGFLDQNYPLICEIDFNPSTTTEEMHYVLLTRHEGDTIYAADPWTGVEINLDVYGGPARAIIQFRCYDKQLLPDPPIDPLKQLIDLKDPWGVMEVQAIISKLNDLSRDLTASQEKGKVLDGFVSKWVEEWKLPQGSTLVDVENEMSRLVLLEDTVQTFRDSIENCVGVFVTDAPLLEAHKQVRKQIEILSEENNKLTQKLNEAKAPKGFKFWTCYHLPYLILKIYKKGGET